MISKTFDSQQGAALVAGMLILVALTLMGVAGLTLTSIDTAISRNYRTSVQAVELANAAVAQMIYWFNNPTTFTDTSTGTYRSGTNTSEKGSNFFAKRRTAGTALSYFYSNRSQFYDVNGDNNTLTNEGSPALEYDAGTPAQKTWLDTAFSSLSDAGNITNLKLWGTSNLGDVCTVQITAENTGGGKATVEVVFVPGPAQGVGEGLEVGGSASFAGKSAKIHWSRMLVVENVDFGNWDSYNPAQRTTGTSNPGDAPDNLLYGGGGGSREHDPWLEVYVGGTISVNDDENSPSPPCSNASTYNWNNKAELDTCNPLHTNVYPGRNNDGDTSNDVRLDKWDYDFSKAYAKKNNIKKGSTIYPGYYYTQSGASNKDKIWSLAGTQYTFSSFINGITEGFMFVDTTNQQVPDAAGTNLQELSLSGNTYTKGSFYVAANVNVSGLGNGTDIDVESPPWDSSLSHGEPDPGSCTDSDNRQDVADLEVHINGPFYIAGQLQGTGNPQVFGAIIVERGSTLTGTPEIWYDYALRDGSDDTSAVITKSWREVRE